MPTKQQVLEKYRYDGTQLVFAKDSGQGGRFKAGTPAGWECNGIRMVSFGNSAYPAHKAIWAIVHGEWPKLPIRHLNGDSLDNRIENLTLNVGSIHRAGEVSVDRLMQLFEYCPDSGLFTRKAAQNNRVKIGDFAGYKDNCGYMRCGVDGKNLLLHRAAWGMFYGEMPNEQIDHINGIRHDNRIANLRLVSQAKNTQNAAIRLDNSTGVKGVSFHKKSGRYMAYINLNLKRQYLGYFDTLEEAKNARIEAEKTLHPFNALHRNYS